MSKTAQTQRGFAPIILVLLIVAAVAVGVAIKSQLLNQVNPSYTPAYNQPKSVKKVDTTKKENIAQATQSAAVTTPAATVASYISCPSYSGSTAVAYPPFPATGPAPLTALLYANGSVDPASGDSLAGYDWDFTGDGKWDTSVSQVGVQYSYPQVGTFTPKFRVRSTQGKVSQTCSYPYTVVVNSGKPTSDSISVSTTGVTVNLSKANPNTSLMIQDNAAYSAGNLYGDGFTVSLLKATGWHLTNINMNTVSFDQTERLGAVGESFRVHTVVPSSVANGTYTGSADLQYFQDGTWHPFATVKVTANVTD